MSRDDADARAPGWQRGYFAEMYREQGDPYGVRTRWYEQRKRQLVLASLPRPRFGNAFEPACGVAELTAALAARCDRVLASDFNDAVLATARERTRDLPQIRIESRILPRDWPHAAAPFDLVVLGEIGYFLSEAELAETARQCAATLADDGVLVACHWRPAFEQRTVPTDRIHALLGAGLHSLVRHAEDDFLLQVWSRDARSVAQREGVR